MLRPRSSPEFDGGLDAAVPEQAYGTGSDRRRHGDTRTMPSTGIWRRSSRVNGIDVIGVHQAAGDVGLVGDDHQHEPERAQAAAGSWNLGVQLELLDRHRSDRVARRARPVG